MSEKEAEKKSSIQINRHISLGCQFEDEKANSINIFFSLYNSFFTETQHNISCQEYI